MAGDRLPCRVLILDSDKSVVGKLTEALAADGCQVDSVEQPSRVIEKVKNRQVDALILAVESRGVKGYDLIPVVKSIDRLVPIIVTSADASIETASRVREQGIFFYAIKPLDMKEMKLAVRNALRAGNRCQVSGIGIGEKVRDRDSEEEIVDVQGASRILKLTRTAVSRMAKSGELPASQIGQGWRFLRNQLYEWLRLTAAGNQRNYGTLILETMDEGVAVVDRRLRIVSCNSAYLQSLDIPRDRVIGEHCYRASHRSTVPCEVSTCPARQAFKTERPVKFMHVNYDAEGRERYCDVVGLPMKDERGKVSNVLEIIRDNTEIYNLNRHLGWVVGFVAHEMKGALSSAVMNISALADLKLSKTIVGEKRDDMLLASLSSLKMMQDMISNYLLTSKGKSGQVQFRRATVDLDGDIVRPVMAELRPLFLKKDMTVSVHVQGGRPVRCDRDLMRIAVGNLINNAIKYGTTGTRIECTVNVAGEGFEFSIFDEGVGIPADKLTEVFDEFTRFDTTGICGTGLGLYVVKMIAGLHDGEVRAESGFIIEGRPVSYGEVQSDEKYFGVKQEELKKFARFTLGVPDRELN